VAIAVDHWALDALGRSLQTLLFRSTIAERLQARHLDFNPAR
jgi:hypothetical protein